jgi:hypothetical protein
MKSREMNKNRELKIYLLLANCSNEYLINLKRKLN